MQDIGGGKVRGDGSGGGGIGPSRGTCGSRRSRAVYRVRADEERHLVFMLSYLSLNPKRFVNSNRTIR